MDTADPGESEKTCRVCRGGEEDGHLYRPCICKGSVAYCHEDCLKNWLSVSRGTRCELCKHTFSWENGTQPVIQCDASGGNCQVYASEAPSRVPPILVLRHALLGCLALVKLLARAFLVSFAWLCLLPYSILWAYRFYFHIGRNWGAAWSSLVRETDWSSITAKTILLHPRSLHDELRRARHAYAASMASQSQAAGSSASLHQSNVCGLKDFNRTAISGYTGLYEAVGDLITTLVNSSVSTSPEVSLLGENQTTSATTSANLWQNAKALPGKYVHAQWARHQDTAYSIARDCFSGQIIVCFVVIIFVAVFLLREWVIANQHHDHPAQQPLIVDMPVEGPPRVLQLPAVVPEHLEILPLQANSSEPPNDAILPQGAMSPLRAEHLSAPDSSSTFSAVVTPPRNENFDDQLDNEFAEISSAHSTHGSVYESPTGEIETSSPSPTDAHDGAGDSRRIANEDEHADHNDDDDEEDDEDTVVEPNAANGRDRQALPNVGDNDDDIFFEADLEGILEAIGMQGPMLALLQNVALMVLLIELLLGLTIWTPLMIGKSLAATNAPKVLLLPVSMVRFVTDPIADQIVIALGSATRLINRLPAAEHSGSGLELFEQSRASALEHTVAVSITAPAQDAIAQAFRNLLGGMATHAKQKLSQRWLEMATNDADIDRILCIILGYGVIFAAAHIYLRSNIARDAPWHIQDSVKQSLIMLKAGSFFIVEILIFPALCGVLLNLATIPLIPGVTFASRSSSFVRQPLSAVFLTWLAGTNFMYGFASIINVIRKCIRKGVLFFIRDPSHPDANPMREILEASTLRQTKKIARSLMIYGSVILSCFGLFPWLLCLCGGVFLPLRWNMSGPHYVFPIDLLLVLFVIPRTLGSTNPRRFIRKMIMHWCILTSQQLRLSSFMLGQRRPEEEGSQIRRSWKAWLLLRRAPVPQSNSDVLCPGQTHADVEFRHDGRFARVVAHDHVKIVPNCMMVRVHEDGSPIDEENSRKIAKQLAEGPNVDSNFKVVYLPPHFGIRIALFIYLLWFTSSVAIFIAFASALFAGRLLLGQMFGCPLHDGYALLLGMHVFLFANTVYRRAAYRYRARNISRRYAQQISFYLQTACVFPLALGLAVHIYAFLPFQPHGQSTAISLSMSWAYGLLYISLAFSTSRMFRADPLADTLAIIRIHNQDLRVALLHPKLTRVNLRLAGIITLPTALCVSYRAVGGVFAYPFRSAPVPGNSETDLALRIAVSIVACVGTSYVARKPAMSLVQSWTRRIWEREYIIQRKLRNVDDSPSAYAVS